jgi:two-component system, LytTR family, sensor kinase
VLVFGASMTSIMWGIRHLVFPLVGLGAHDYGRMPTRYFMELAPEIIIYTLFVCGYYLVDRYRVEREKALRAAKLEAGLLQARLKNLELQLKPHFLFNAMNAISATMYEDAAAADEMLGHLAELLRASLRTGDASEVTLHDELALLDHYLSIMHARFGAGLRIDVDVAAEARECVVPALVLQPLVENAVKHGGAEAVGRGAIAVRARRDGEWLRLDVTDDGPAGSPAEGGNGIGLRATRERLELLYGARCSFAAGPEMGGGYRVAIGLPARRAAAVPG